jgi:hypothetical protein
MISGSADSMPASERFVHIMFESECGAGIRLFAPALHEGFRKEGGQEDIFRSISRPAH